MNVDQMLETVNVNQFAEWAAYEKFAGPIGGGWQEEVLAEIQELLQLNNQFTAAAITKKGKKNPAGKFRKVVRPWELFRHVDEDDDEEDDEED